MSLPSSIVSQCLRITKRDNVTIFHYPHSTPMAEDIAEECFKKGADVMLDLYTERYHLSYLKELPVEILRKPSPFCRALAEVSTVQIFLGGVYDPSILKKFPPEKEAATSEGETKAHFPISRQRKIRILSVNTSLVTEPRAKVYGFNFQKWKGMVERASAIDYDLLAKTGRKLQEGLAGAKAIRVTGRETDLTFEVSGRKWLVSDGVIDRKDVEEGNLQDEIPAGSITVCPIEDSAEGTVTYNSQLPFMGEKVGRLKLAFKDGRIKTLSGDPSIGRLKRIWNASSGDKDKIATFTIGFNPRASSGFVSNNIVAGAVTIGIGENRGIGGKNKSGFGFAHTLMRATVKADGKTVVSRGRLV